MDKDLNYIDLKMNQANKNEMYIVEKVKASTRCKLNGNE